MFRMRSATSGLEVLSSVSEQPVQSWKCSQMTEGRFALAIWFAILVTEVLSVSASPTGAVTMSMEHKLTKFLRENPARFKCSPMVGFSEGSLSSFLVMTGSMCAYEVNCGDQD